MVGLFCMKYPYTYLIGWSKHNLWYYGARFANTKLPEEDLWVKYFTSSSHVKTARKTLGEPDVVQVRRHHASPQSALLWESKVLQRLRVLKNDHWLNANIGGKEFSNINGRSISEDTKIKIGLARRRWWQSLNDQERKELMENSGSRMPGAAAKISTKAKARLSNHEFLAEWIRVRNTPEYLTNLSKKMTLAWSDPTKKKNHSDAMAKPSYKANLKAAMAKVNADPEVNRKRSETMKATLSSPEARLQRSLAAKASHDKRLATYKANRAKLLQNNA